MATYKQIREYVKQKFGYTPKDCWIAHSKELSSLPMKQAHNRKGERKNPYPENKLEGIQDAFWYFGMVEG